MVEVHNYAEPYPTPEPEPYHPEETVLPDPVDAPPPPDNVYLETPQEAWDYAEQLAQEKTSGMQAMSVQAEPAPRDRAMAYLEQQMQTAEDQRRVQSR